MAEVDSLEISIEASATKAVERVAELIKKLEELKAAYTNVPNNSFGGEKKTNIPGPSKSTKQDYSSLREIIASVGKEMANMKPKALQAAKAAAQASNAMRALSGTKYAPSVSEMSDALGTLSTAVKSSNSAWGNTKLNIQATANAFSILTPAMQKALLAEAKMHNTNVKTAKSFGLLGIGISNATAKFGVYYIAFRRIASVAGGWVKSANDYIEATNLFSVSMGDYYDEALAYAELVNQKMGIDIAEWMDAQGTFKLMADGFGIAEDQAYELSKGLTELAYDISSLKNIDPGEAVTKLRSALAGELEPIRALGLSISQATLQEYALSKGIKEAVTSMTEQEKALLRSVKVMEDATRIGYVGDFAKTLESPANAMRILKQQITEMGRALGTVLLPAITQMLPWIQAFVSLLTDAIKALATFVGFTMPEWDSKSWEKSGENIEEAIGGATAAAKEFKDATLGIDELNVISPPSPGGGAGAGGLSDWASTLDIPPIWDEQMLEGIKSKSQQIKKTIQDALDDVSAIVSGASLAVGAILTLTGANTPLGIALMAAGAVGLASSVALNWGKMDSQLRGTLRTITGAVGGFSLALGALLTFSGVNIPLGLSLMAIGAASLISAVALNWGGMEGNISSALGTITAVISGGLLAVGALFTFTGANVPLGIALMAVGAAGLATAAAINWGFIESSMSGVLSTITGVVSGFAFAIGALMAFSGASLPLGIGLMIAGAAGMAATVALNWDSSVQPISDTLSTITGVVAGAALAVGAMMALTGANVPLGLGLMLVGAGTLATSVAVNWNSLDSSVSESISSIAAIVSASALVVGSLLLLSGVGVPLGMALLFAGATSLASSVAINWDTMSNQLRETLTATTAVVGGFLLAIGAIFVMSGAGLPLGIGMMLAGATGLASAVALNWNFVTSKVTSTLQEIGAIAGVSLLALGLLLLVTGAGIPLGIGLLLAGGASLASSVALNWDFLTQKVGEMFGDIGEKFQEFASEWLSVEKWVGLATSAVEGFMGGLANIGNGIWNWGEGLINDIKSVLGIHSPSTEFESIGEYAMAGLENGFETMPNITALFSNEIESMRLVASGFAEETLSMIRGAYDTLLVSLTDGMTAVKAATDSMSQMFRTMSNNSISAINGIISSLNSIPRNITTTHTVVTKNQSSGSSAIKAYASGGFPDHGQMFLARESGPELVGTIGQRTAVANNSQIEAGIEEAAYRGFLRAMAAQQQQPVVVENKVYLDRKQLRASMRQADRESGAGIMSGGVLAY